MRTLITLVLFVGLPICFITAQTDGGQKTNSKLIQVQDNVYMLQGKGGNIGLSIGNDGVLMIDDQFADATDDILKDIRRISKKPIQFLVNTHHHPDHTGGNVNMVKEGAIVVSHENVRNRLLENIKNATDKSSDANPKLLATITFKDDMSLHYNGENILIFHVHDAHTDGDAIIYFPESNVIHVGDILFNGKYPYIDLESGGTLKGYIEAIEKIMIIVDNDTKIIPGHGDVGTKSDLAFEANMLQQLYRKVTYHYMNQKSETEILQMRDFTKKYDDLGYGDGFISTEKILKSIYNEVKKERGVIDNRSLEDRMKEIKEKRAAADKNGG